MRQVKSGAWIAAIALFIVIFTGCGPRTRRAGVDGLFNAAGDVALQFSEPPSTIRPIHITGISLAAEADERFGIRVFGGIQTQARGDPSSLNPNTGQTYEYPRGNVLERLTDFNNPVLFVDINYIAELDDNFWLELFIGSVPGISNGFPTPMPVGNASFKDYELTLDRGFVVVGASGLMRIGSGRFARVYGGLGLNAYFSEAPGQQETFGATMMLSMDLSSSENVSLSLDAKYWLMDFGQQEYLLVGGNLAFRY